jgi:hypothetical protein
MCLYPVSEEDGCPSRNAGDAAQGEQALHCTVLHCTALHGTAQRTEDIGAPTT